MPSADSRGVTLIDTLVGTALIVLVFVGIAGAFLLAIDVVTNNRARAGAIALMNERMEYIRSLNYASVGTVGGIPSGPIAQSESLSLSGISYMRRTTIQYVDDPEDGENETDENGIIVDYKQARIEVSWDSRTGERRVIMVARVEPLNGLEIECDTPCGTLRIDVFNAASEPVQSAQVNIVNDSVNPAINITTYANVNGRVVLAGAPVASGYEVSVSKTGHNTAQTYSSSVENPNPTPTHVTILQNQTASVTFGLPNSGIDYLATKRVSAFWTINSETWDEPFSDTSQIASSTNITVAGGEARLSGSGSYPAWGEFESIAIGHGYLARWQSLNWGGTTPADTTITVQLLDTNRTPIPDTALPGNAMGFTSSTVDLYSLSTTTYPTIVLRATLTTTDASTTPTLDSYSVLYDYGPIPFPNAPLSVRGTKQIGTDPVVYKYDESDLETDANGFLELSNMEWDTYTIVVPLVSGYDLAYSCAPQPEYLAPGTSQNTSLYLTVASSTDLRIAVTGNLSEFVPGATVAISSPGLSATSTTGSCGQVVFPSVDPGTYNYTVSADGYADESGSVSALADQLVIENVELTPQ